MPGRTFLYPFSSLYTASTLPRSQPTARLEAPGAGNVEHIVLLAKRRWKGRIRRAKFDDPLRCQIQFRVARGTDHSHILQGAICPYGYVQHRTRTEVQFASHIGEIHFANLLDLAHPSRDIKAFRRTGIARVHPFAAYVRIRPPLGLGFEASDLT